MHHGGFHVQRARGDLLGLCLGEPRVYLLYAGHLVYHIPHDACPQESADLQDEEIVEGAWSLGWGSRKIQDRLLQEDPCLSFAVSKSDFVRLPTRLYFLDLVFIHKIGGCG